MLHDLLVVEIEAGDGSREGGKELLAVLRGARMEENKRTFEKGLKKWICWLEDIVRPQQIKQFGYRI